MEKGIILFEVLQFLFYSLILGIALTPCIFLIKFLFLISPILLAFSVVLIVWLFFLVVILELFIVRSLAPQLKKGYYNNPNSKMFYIWTSNFMFSRLLFNDPFRNIILYFATLRYLAITALGGKISLFSSISANVSIVDIPMLELGKGSMIGAWCVISGHFMIKDKIGIGKVVIGNNVNIGASTHIGPNVIIGDNTNVGIGCKISPLVEIGENCTIEPLTVIPSGTVIPDNTTYKN
jgi:hypothetical protein